MQNNSFLRRILVSKSHQNKNDKDDKKDENNDAQLANGVPSLLVADFELVKLQVNQSISIEKTKFGTNARLQRLFLENEGFKNIISLPLQATTLGTLSLQGVEDSEGQSGIVGTQDVLPSLSEERLFYEGGNYYFSSPSLSEELNIERIEGTAGSVPSIQSEIKSSDFHFFGIVLSTLVAGVVVFRVLFIPTVLPTVKSWGVKLISEFKPLIENSVRFLGVLLEPKFVVVFG